MNIISNYTDQNIAIKFLSDKKASLELTAADDVTIRKLKKLNKAACENFTELLPQAASRWKEMHRKIDDYIKKIKV